MTDNKTYLNTRFHSPKLARALGCEAPTMAVQLHGVAPSKRLLTELMQEQGHLPRFNVGGFIRQTFVPAAPQHLLRLLIDADVITLTDEAAYTVALNGLGMVLRLRDHGMVEHIATLHPDPHADPHQLPMKKLVTIP